MEYLKKRINEEFGIWVADNDSCELCKSHDSKVYLLDELPYTHSNCDCKILPIDTSYARMLLVDKSHNGKRIKPVDGDLEVLFDEVEVLADEIKENASIVTKVSRLPRMNIGFIKKELTEMTAIGIQFVKYVDTGEQYDIKNQDWYKKKYNAYEVVYDGNYIDHDVPGNILYGYFGAALGFPVDVLVMAGGVVQIKDGNTRWDYINFDNFGDDPKDTDAVRLGYKIYVERNR